MYLSGTSIPTLVAGNILDRTVGYAISNNGFTSPSFLLAVVVLETPM
jgi:hypothetical protein